MKAIEHFFTKKYLKKIFDCEQKLVTNIRNILNINRPIQ